METQIKLIQAPVIQHQLQIIGKEVSERIAALNIDNQVATEDTVKTLKEIRAELNKEAKIFETQRMDVKKALMSPYDEFEVIYKTEIIDKFKAADDVLKTKIYDFELKIKQDKKQNLIEYFNEFCEANSIDFLKFERMNLDINLSTSEKKYKEQILEFINKVADDLALIETEEYAAEILVEYKNSLNASVSITNIRNRKEQEKIQAERLLANRTQQRIQNLRNLTFVYSDLTKSYMFVKNENILIRLSDIETLENGNWTKKYVELENAVKDFNKSEVCVSSPKVEPSKPEQPIKQETKEEIFTITFEVSGTYQQLVQLRNFLNDYQLKFKQL